MNRCSLSYRARLDLYDAFDFLCNDSLRKALRWEEALLAAFDHIANFPLSGRAHPLVSAPLRVWSVSNHLIIYDPSDDPINIVAIVHAARNLGEFLVERLPSDSE